MRKLSLAKCCPADNADILSRPLTGQVANEDLCALTKAIGHPVRVQILRLLIDRDSCVCGEIVSEIPLAQSTVSQHLKVLKEAGLIRGDIDGPNTCYCIHKQGLQRLKILIASL